MHYVERAGGLGNSEGVHGSYEEDRLYLQQHAGVETPSRLSTFLIVSVLVVPVYLFAMARSQPRQDTEKGLHV